nr:1,2-epoxyphenylacetyl-CoA isomerase-like [Nerophis lumbriciformis]
MSQYVEIIDQGGVRTVTMNRPELKNALSHEMYATMAEAISSAAEDPAVRVVLLAGAGDIFTSGNDLKDFMDSPPGLGPGDQPPVLRFLHAIATTPKPLLAAVGGLAVGVGTTMLLHCDLVYAADTATFSTPFVDLGLVPEAASSMLLPQIAGFRRAAEMLLLGQPLDATEAESCGLVSRVVAADQLEQVSHDAAQKLAAKAPHALRSTKALLRRNVEQVPERMKEEMEYFAKALNGDEFKEAATAFMAKRKPDFSRFS